MAQPVPPSPRPGGRVGGPPAPPPLRGQAGGRRAAERLLVAVALPVAATPAPRQALPAPAVIPAARAAKSS
eukprot:13547210-Alexandrium_andersonii.AAC.1